MPAGPGPPPHPRWHLWVPWGSGGGFFTNPATPPHPTPPFVAKALVPEHGNELDVAVWGCLWARRPAPKPPIALPGPPGVAEGAGVGWAADLWPPWHPAGCFTAWRWGSRGRFAGVCLLWMVLGAVVEWETLWLCHSALASTQGSATTYSDKAPSIWRREKSVHGTKLLI